MRVLAFDIGIKNLAWCLMEKGELDSSGKEIIPSLIGLSNVNIMENWITSNAIEKEDRKDCMKPECKVLPSFQVGERGFCCRRHLPKDYKFLPNPDGGDLVTKIPNISQLKKLLSTDELKEAKKNGTKRDIVLEIIRRRFALPLSRKKKKNTNKIGPEELHDYIRFFCQTNFEIFKTADIILLENQPAFKNPHMKTVQILLFATLRSLILDSKKVPFYFIHAGKKTAGAKKGDTGYLERKTKSEERVECLFSEMKILGDDLISEWRNAKKKSDMADVVCMCWDFQR